MDHELAEQSPRRISGVQMGFLMVYAGASGVAGVYAAGLVAGFGRRLILGLSTSVLTFGALILLGLRLFGDEPEN